MQIALKKILAPTDFSDASAAALTYAWALAENFKASLTLLHVVEQAALYAPAFFEGVLPVTANVEEELTKSSQQRLAEMLASANRAQISATATVVTGNPYVEIVRHAAENEIDLIVLGTHGRGAIAHLLMGGVAEKVVRNAPCPVLTVRHPEHEFVMP